MAALRSARRGMRIAAEIGVPLVLLIDTQGAALSREECAAFPPGPYGP